MADVQLNGKSITTTSATTAPAAGTSETWTVTALASGIRTLVAGETYALVDATTGATTAQQAEIVRVTAATAGATSITVTRGYDGTTPVAHANPATFNIVLTAGSVRRVLTPDYAQPDPASTYFLKNEWDPIHGLYNFKGSDTRRTDSGMGNSMMPGGGISEELVIGDSLSAGAINLTLLTYDRLRAWPLAMRDAMPGLRANGTGFVRCIDSNAIDTRWVFVGAWSGFGTCSLSNTVGNTATFSPDRGGTVLDVWYYDSSGGTMSISVDGATSGAGFRSKVTNGSAGWKYERLYGVDIMGGFSKVVVTVTATGATGVLLSGASVWTPNGGLVIHNVAQSGSTATGSGAASWLDIASGTAPGLVFNDAGGRRRVVTDAASTVGSSTLTSATGAFTISDRGKPIDEINIGATTMWPPNCFIGDILTSSTATIYQGVGPKAVPVNAQVTLSAQSVSIGRDPAVVHFALGTNDLQNGALTMSDITTAITTLRNRFPNSDAMLHLPPEMSTTLVTAARQKQFQQAMFKLADDLDAPLYDWRDRAGSYTTGQSFGVYGDNAVHLVPSTEASLGATLAGSRGPASGPSQQNYPPVLDADVVPKSYIDRRKVKTTSATATTTVESVVLRLPIPANGLAVGDVFRYALWLTPAASTITTIKVRVGALGTIADTAVLTMSATAATNAGARYAEGQVGVGVIGASATFIGGGTETVGAITAAGTASASSGTFNSTVNNWATVTVTNTTSTTTTVRAGTLEWV